MAGRLKNHERYTNVREKFITRELAVTLRGRLGTSALLFFALSGQIPKHGRTDFRCSTYIHGVNFAQLC